MRIYTKTGDQGQTTLFGGERVSKHHLRIEASGTLDELNSYVGLISDQPVYAEHDLCAQRLRAIQWHLFVVGAHLATPVQREKLALPELPESALKALEEDIDRMSELVEPLRYFILPGGHTAISITHIARSVCRRAERCVVALQAAQEPVAEQVLPYINRLSDYLFMLCRVAAKELGVAERPWIPEKKSPLKTSSPKN